MKLTRVSKESFRFQLGRREKHLLVDLSKLYPRVPPEHLPVSKNGTLPDKQSSQKLLQEALAEQRNQNKARVETVLSNPSRWSQHNDSFSLELSEAELDWLLQILNDIRVGSWLRLGAPEEGLDHLDKESAPEAWVMELAGFFQMFLIHALEQEK